jgi:tetratricopeptide (TPR) repeat protein
VLLSVQGDLEGAEPYLRRVVDGRRRALGDRHRRTLGAVRNLGSLLRRMGDLEAAEPLLREALEGFRQSLGDEHAETILSTLDLAALRRDQGRAQESTELTAWALAQAKKGLSPSHRGMGEALVSHGLNLALAGRFPEAEAALLEGREILATADPARAQEAAEHLAELYRRRGRAR